jgi:uncharacterized protein HemX
MMSMRHAVYCNEGGLNTVLTGTSKYPNSDPDPEKSALISAKAAPIAIANLTQIKEFWNKYSQFRTSADERTEYVMQARDEQLRTIEAAKARLAALDEMIKTKAKTLQEVNEVLKAKEKEWVTEIQKVTSIMNERSRRLQQEYDLLLECEDELNFLANGGSEYIDQVIEEIILGVWRERGLGV